MLWFGRRPASSASGDAPSDDAAGEMEVASTGRRGWVTPEDSGGMPGAEDLHQALVGLDALRRWPAPTSAAPKDSSDTCSAAAGATVESAGCGLRRPFGRVRRAEKPGLSRVPSATADLPDLTRPRRPSSPAYHRLREPIRRADRLAGHRRPERLRRPAGSLAVTGGEHHSGRRRRGSPGAGAGALVVATQDWHPESPRISRRTAASGRSTASRARGVRSSTHRWKFRSTSRASARA